MEECGVLHFGSIYVQWLACRDISAHVEPLVIFTHATLLAKVNHTISL